MTSSLSQSVFSTEQSGVNNWKSTSSNLHSAVGSELQLDGHRKGFTRWRCPCRFLVKLPCCGCMQKLLAAAPAESRGSKPRGVRDALSAILAHVCSSLWHLRSAQSRCRDARWVTVREGKIFYIYIHLFCSLFDERKEKVAAARSLSSGPSIHLLFILHHLWLLFLFSALFLWIRCHFSNRHSLIFSILCFCLNDFLLLLCVLLFQPSFPTWLSAALNYSTGVKAVTWCRRSKLSTKRAFIEEEKNPWLPEKYHISSITICFWISAVYVTV